MSLPQAIQKIEYPESDGRPMGETDLHRDWMVRILEVLRYRYRNQRTYVASNLLVYYEEGVPSRFVVPDTFLVFDCDSSRRRVFKTWEEKRVPNVAFEVTSRSTRRDDESFKPQTYERIGVQEYFLYDPSGEYLSPPLKGFVRRNDGFIPLAAGDNGSLVSEQLGAYIGLDGHDLVMRDIDSGELWLTEAEAAKAEIAKLKAELDQLRKQP